jgi:ABC-type dipeptide/oligopeptide/nickel transport system ATPase component
MQHSKDSLNPVKTVGYQIAEACRVKGGLQGWRFHRQSVEILEAAQLCSTARKMDRSEFEIAAGFSSREEE